MTDDLPDTGRARYFELQRLARTQGRDTQELLILYALEGWLARLAASSHGDRLVLKGGMLLSAFGQRRPTRDLDVQAQLAADTDTVRGLVAEVADIGIDDGLAMDAAGATAQLIRDADEYSGVRVSVPVGLYSARLTVKVDVNVGDPIWPAPETIRLPRLLNDEPLVLRGYPLHMVLAEKIVTAIARGVASTRWRDFADIYLLIRHHTVDGSDLHEAVRRVASHRAVRLTPPADVLDGYAPLAQPKWGAWRTRQDLTDRLPDAFAEVVAAVIDFADPVVAGQTTGAVWQPTQAVWDPEDV